MGFGGVSRERVSQIWTAESRGGRLARDAVLLCAGVALLSLSAQIKIPFYPVPLTLQSLVVLLIGLSYGLSRGVSTVVAYVAVGAAGAPVFAGGGGWAYLVGPTGGFLLGFVLAAAVVGYAVRRGWCRGFVRAFAVLLAADALIFIAGVAHLSLFIGMQKAVAVGVVPFVLGDLCKVAVAAAVLTLWRRRSQT